MTSYLDVSVETLNEMLADTDRTLILMLNDPIVRREPLLRFNVRSLFTRRRRLKEELALAALDALEGERA